MIIPHNKITFDDAEIKAVSDVIGSGQWVGGVVQNKLEQLLCDLFSVQGAACVGSGLSALRLSLLALGIKEGDEVIIPAYSCVALTNAVLSVDAIPVCADIDLKNFNICPESVKKILTKKTKAIIAVNSFGLPADMIELKKLNIPVIEDCSHGFKINERNNPQAIKSDIAIFSFYATKLIAGGEGGAILSYDQNIINYVKGARDYSDQPPSGKRLNDKMTDIESALVEIQLSKLPDFLKKRYELAQIYNQKLSNIGAIKLPTMSDKRVWYRYVIKLKNEAQIESIIKQCDESGVSFRRPVENWLDTKITHYPNAEKAYNTALSLPLYPTLTNKEQNFVIDILKKVVCDE